MSFLWSYVTTWDKNRFTVQLRSSVNYLTMLTFLRVCGPGPVIATLFVQLVEEAARQIPNVTAL